MRRGCVQNCSFSIDEETDPNRQFSVNSYGLITTAKPLDRETQREHRIHVLATDKGKDWPRSVRSVARPGCAKSRRRAYVLPLFLILNNFRQTYYINIYWTSLCQICRVGRCGCRWTIHSLLCRSLKGICVANNCCWFCRLLSRELGLCAIWQMAAYNKKCECCTGRRQTN